VTTHNNPVVASALAEANRHMQTVRTAVTAVETGYGGRTLSPSETLLMLKELHNAVARLIQAVSVLDRGVAQRQPF
jgi:hypothetical protein